MDNLGKNLAAVETALGLTPMELRQLAENSFRASFLPAAEKQRHLGEIAAVPPAP